MKIIQALVVLLLVVGKTGFADEPDRKPKTDAMLFGGIKSGDEHIPFATIAVKGTTVGAAADATGHFKMINLPVGKQVIVFSAVGYKTHEMEVFLESNKSVTLAVELEPDVIGIEQVIISADRSSKSRRETPTIVNSINPKLFQRTQNVTLSEGLNFSPGLRMENNCQNCGFSQVRMNGLEGPYSQILINSRPVFSGLAGVYGLELIPANMIDRVEVIRGGGSAMYGSNAIAGTINLITKDPVNNGFSASASNGLTSAAGNSANDFSMNFNGSFVSDDFKTGLSLFGFTRNRDPYDANNDGFSELSLIENATLGTRIYQRIADRGKLSLDYFHIGEFRRGGNRFELPLHEADVTESVRHRINSGAATFDLLMRDADKFSVYFSAQGVQRDSYYGANQDLSAYGETQDFSWSSGVLYIRQFNRLLFSPASVTSGAEYNGGLLEDQKLGYFDVEKNTHFGNTPVADQSIATQAAFLQSEWKLKNAVVTAGVRFDHYSISDKTRESNTVTGNVLSPRLSFLYNLTHDLQFRGGFARGFRAPQIFDEDLHIETSGSRQVLHQNDPDLKQESSNSVTASFDYTKNFGRWQVQLLAEGFYTRLLDPFANEYGEPDENGVVVYTRVNAENGATVKGMNFELNASPSARFQIQSGFTVQKGVFEEPQEFGEKRFFRSPGQYGYLSLNFSPSMLLNISFTGNYTGPMLVPYFGPLAANPETGQLNTSSSFFDAGFKVSYDVRLTEVVKMQLNAGIKNLFNSYQRDFDSGINRDPAYIYGPTSPQMIYFGLKFGNFW
jgi:outer membrane receptor for ferrienterochelin and colicins